MPARRTATTKDLFRLRALLSAQFGPSVAGDLTSRPLEVELRHGKIRYVYLEGRRLMTLRPRDFTFTLSLDGAELVRSLLPPPRLRVTLVKPADIVVGALVLSADKLIRPGDEVLLVDSDDRLLGVGKARVPGFMMSLLKDQEVVRVREVVEVVSQEG